MSYAFGHGVLFTDAGRGVAGLARGATVERVQSNASGDIVVLAAHPTPSGYRDDLYTVARRAGHGFGRPQRIIAGRRSRPVSLAVGPHGRALVAWSDGSRIRTRARTRAGRLLPVQTVAEEASALDVSIAAGRQRRAAVTWTSQDVTPGDESRRTEDAVHGSTRIRVAVAPTGGRFGPAQDLDGFAEPVSLTRCHAALATARPDGRTRLLWVAAQNDAAPCAPRW